MIQGLTQLEFNLFVKEQIKSPKSPKSVSLESLGTFGSQMITRTDAFIKLGISRVQSTIGKY
jgi:hypothetical protein